MRKDGLTQLATVIGIQCETKEEVTAAVGHLTADKVKQFVADWRKEADAEIGRATSTYEANLRKKYNLVEKQEPAEPKPDSPKPKEGAITLESIRQLIDESLKPLQTGLSAINADRDASSRRELFVAELDKAKVSGATRDMFLRDFERVKGTFAKAEDFDAYITEKQGDIAALSQATADKGLADTQPPLFGTVNEKGVSAGVDAYLKAQTDNKLGGKEI